MKLLAAILFALIALSGGVYLFSRTDTANRLVTGSRDTPTKGAQNAFPTENPEGIAVIADHLDTPWAIAFLPEGGMLVTERPGRLRLIDATGKLQENPIATVDGVREIGEGGLLGVTLHPKFAENRYIFLYYTYSGTGDRTMNRVSRFTYDNDRLTGERVIVDQIPGASNHNGGRIKFGPDGLLYIGTGDAGEPSEAQDTKSLAGKILRVTEEGRTPPDNSFQNEVYSYGHRNVQGITWDEAGNLWATEHGRSGVTTGFDELNFVEKGKNYGWPTIQGTETRAGMVTPKRNSGATTTWAPSGIAFLHGSLYFAGLKGRTLYQPVLSGTSVTDLREHFVGQFGRFRETIVGPDGMLYLTTSNRDGRGVPSQIDDRILRINSSRL